MRKNEALANKVEYSQTTKRFPKVGNLSTALMYGMSRRAYHHDGVLPQNNSRIIFVFDSNLAGSHGIGIAKAALLNFGARFGVGEGRTGNAYAIPTEDHQLNTRSLSEIELSVKRFIEYATTMPSLRFFITRIGCRLASYGEDVASMFVGAPDNCIFPEEWANFLEEE